MLGEFIFAALEPLKEESHILCQLYIPFFRFPLPSFIITEIFGIFRLSLACVISTL